MARRQPDALARPRNQIGTPLATDGRPVFDDATGESRQQYLARIRAEQEAALRARLAAEAAEFKAELEAKKSADQPPTPPSTPDKE